MKINNTSEKPTSAMEFLAGEVISLAMIMSI